MVEESLAHPGVVIINPEILERRLYGVDYERRCRPFVGRLLLPHREGDHLGE